MLLRLALAGALSTALVLSQAPSPAAAATPPGTRIELNVTGGNHTPAELEHVLDQAVKAHATSIYCVVNWASVAPQAARRYQWDRLDRLAARASARGLKLRFQLTGSPDWLHPALVRQGVPAWRRAVTPPTNPTELLAFQSFTKDVAARFRSTVSRFEIWNEPNEKNFFQPAPNPTRYANLLRAGSRGIRQGAPNAQVLFGGISRNDLGFLSKVYAAIDAMPNRPANHYFDTLSVHPYSGDRAPSYNDPHWVYATKFGLMDENFLGLKKMYALMAAHKEGYKHLYVGEYGFSTDHNGWWKGVPDSTRASYIGQAYRLTSGLWYVDGMNWYSLVGNQWDDPSWTLLTAAGAPTQTYNALVAYQG